MSVKNTAFWDVTPCSSEEIYEGFGAPCCYPLPYRRRLNLEAEGQLRNFREFPPDCTMSHPQRQYFTNMYLFECCLLLECDVVYLGQYLSTKPHSFTTANKPSSMPPSLQLQISTLFRHVIRLACWLLWQRVDDFLFLATIPPPTSTHILKF